MNKEQYQAWAAHPQTVQFFEFLMDYRQMMMDKWAAGELVGDAEIANRAKAQQAFMFANLADDAIEVFYKERKVEVNHAE